MYCKWANEFMKKAINAIMDEFLSVRGTSQLFCVPLTIYTANRVAESNFVSAALSALDTSAHLRVFSCDQENVLLNRLLHLQRIG
jgi:hypothetical protein